MKSDVSPSAVQPRSASRRAFLRNIPVVTAAAGTPFPTMAGARGKHQWAMLIDVRKCIGCQACPVSCIQENAVPEGSFRTVVSTYSVKLTDAAQVAGGHLHVAALVQPLRQPALHSSLSGRRGLQA